jgi:hypothetical protein
VTETVRSLIAFLTARDTDVMIEVLDLSAHDNEWESLPVRRIVPEDALCISGLALPQALRIPALWFESYFMVTITEPCPYSAGRLSGVLDAQAEPLRYLGNPQIPEALVYEAHRLAPSDLSVSCGYADWGDSTSERWWAVSLNDVAVDQIVARAAGVEPNTLPNICAIARHEVFALAPELYGSLPNLCGYASPAWRARISAVRSKVSTFWHTTAHDLSMLHHNIHRIPQFVRRRLVKATRKWGRA